MDKAQESVEITSEAVVSTDHALVCATREPYQPPVLRHYGSVRVLTQVGGIGLKDGALTGSFRAH
jgi:hypothetical protein